jgi:Sulfatase
MKRMPVDDAIRVTRENLLLPGENLVDPDKFPLLRTSPPNDMLVKKPRNVVLVLMESFSARFNDAISADFGATPNFAALARESILYDRAFSVSTHTAPGVFGTLCSFPILPTIVGLMGFDTPHQSFGRDLFRLPQEDRGHAFVKRSGEPLLGWIEEDSIFVGSVLAPPGFHRINLGFPPSASDDLMTEEPGETKGFSRKLDAMVITGLHILENRLAAPK